MLGKKKDEVEDDDVAVFAIEGQEESGLDLLGKGREGVQSFTIRPETVAEDQSRKEPANSPQVTESPDKEETIAASPQGETKETGAVNEQLDELSSNLKNLVYDFRSFMSEAGSPFNPNEIPAKESQVQRTEAVSTHIVEEGEKGQGYISAKSYGTVEKEAVESPSDVQSRFADKYLKSKLLETQGPSLSAASKFRDALKAVPRGTAFSENLKSSLDSTDMPALIRAVNSTDYLLHAVGRKNLLRILEVGTREGWIRPEVERLVLSVAEVLSSSGVEVEERSISVSDLLRVVYFLNRLLDPEISDFLSMNAIQERQYIASRHAQR